ncbi:hypothetical protein [Candidatus Cardinium hertigii]|uniref:Uncharacterized protein n=1 Tax=Candidatus Cardinium hertigii TaxID=247481 RepID=A0A2Z3LHD8_9BACT|nr:hypothetical protein [Candidatus Cardinium hertigii]AWN81854.1 hypothetical protein DK880_00534 [Candidatus Cardinium hertigii]
MIPLSALFICSVILPYMDATAQLAMRIILIRAITHPSLKKKAMAINGNEALEKHKEETKKVAGIMRIAKGN